MMTSRFQNRSRHQRLRHLIVLLLRNRTVLVLVLLLLIVRKTFQTIHEMWFNISAVNMYDERAFATDPDHDVLLLKHPEILLYITTHFSDQHIRYFRCCWPKLIAESTLISHAHILIMASNETTVPQEDLTYLSDLFSRNPSYQFKVLPREDWQTRCAKYQNEAVRGNNPLKTPVNYKQCVANLGVQVGFQHGWVFSTPNNSSSFDWMIRINPDVLIRKSSWLLQTMSNRKVQGIFAICNTRQLHTDFFAVRPSILPHSAFSEMGIKATKLNHERTAYREFKQLLEDNSTYRLLPDVDPSEGSCRVRGASASVYHVHDSCIPDTDGSSQLHCNALDGWNLAS